MGEAPEAMLAKFAAFPVIQVIDLDAAIGRGSNEAIVEWLATKARTRIGGGVRTAAKARRLLDLGAEKVIIGTAAFSTLDRTKHSSGNSPRVCRAKPFCWRWTRKMVGS
jgi:phosphoribosylformimino-5-aminoimidazole carboxamide ribonucleotide (ProFAR) isomerase